MKTIISTTLALLITSITFCDKIQAQCHLRDWTALKALYESTDGDNWTNRDGWDTLINGLSRPTLNCNLKNLFGVELNNLGYVDTLDLERNQLLGNIPSELGNLSYLTCLKLDRNQLNESIPPELGNLSNLEYLKLDRNQLSGSIPSEFGSLSNLEYLELDGNQLTGSIPPELGNLTSLTYLSIGKIMINIGDSTAVQAIPLPPELINLISLTDLKVRKNHLSGLIPPELGNLVNLTHLELNGNELSGNIPPELGNLINLIHLALDKNVLSGSVPPELGNLINLTYLSLNNNQLSGNISFELENLNTLNLKYNYFSCQDIPSLFYQNQLQTFSYSPQYFTPANYNDIKSNVFDTLSINQSLNIEIDFPFDTAGFNFQWLQNGDSLTEATQAVLNIDSIKPNNTGKYTLRLESENCLPNGNTFTTISEPMYVILKGYDLLGQPVQYDQLVVGFDNAEETEKYKDEILAPNAGIEQKDCNCNRELYLWQFPSTEAATNALLEIDKKIHTVKTTNKPRGGFNNIIDIGETSNTSIAYNILNDNFSENYQDSVSIFILDSGLDEQNYDGNLFLNDQASVDICYSIESTAGYSFIDTTITVTTDYQDDLWHGTFGFRSITENLNDNTNIELVPLKIFDESGKGALFDMICALYFAIDNNADIINISAGFNGQPSYELERAINIARQKGIFIVAAAGNDSLDMDVSPQYPAYYASQHYIFETSPEVYDSIRYDNVISVASINIDDNISLFSNYGKESVTLACYGENIHGYGLNGNDVVASGSSMATYFASKALALEIAENRQRDYQQVWDDFETDWLITNSKLSNITRTGKQIEFAFEEAAINGCTDVTNCNYFPFASIDDGSCLPAFINLVDSANQFVCQYYANDSIFSNNIINSFNSKIYKAGNLIKLENGFKVKIGAEFRAVIENCE